MTIQSPANNSTVLEISGQENIAKEVAVVSLSGKLIIKLNFTGSRYVWDLKDSSGRKVTPGMYLVKFKNNSLRLVVY